MPLMPLLPTERVSVAAPFTNTGIDYLDHFISKQKENKQKVWVCILLFGDQSSSSRVDAGHVSISVSSWIP